MKKKSNHPERKDYYSKNLSILNISSYNDWNLFCDAKILGTQEIMTLFNESPNFKDCSEIRSAKFHFYYLIQRIRGT